MRLGAGKMVDGSLQGSVLAAFREILNLPELSMQDDFFSSGGNSLDAVNIAAKLTGLSGRAVSPTLILLNPVIADFAREFAAQ
jgi:hypothetical protein